MFDSNEMDQLGFAKKESNIFPSRNPIAGTEEKQDRETEFASLVKLFDMMETKENSTDSFVNNALQLSRKQSLEKGGKVSYPSYTSLQLSQTSFQPDVLSNIENAANTGQTAQDELDLLIGDDPHADTDTPDPDLGAGKGTPASTISGIGYFLSEVAAKTGLLPAIVGIATGSETGGHPMGAESVGADEGGGSSTAEAGDGDPSGEDVGAADGGQIKGHQDGEQVLSEPIASSEEQADTELDDLGIGPLGVINDPDGTTGVADDLDMDLPVGSYVLNAEAVELTGKVSINKMIKEAVDLAIEDGVDLPAEIKTAEKVPIKISRGEAALPHPLDMYIGTSKLEKMNNRGLKLREQREGEKAPVEMAAAPSPEEDLLAQVQQPVA